MPPSVKLYTRCSVQSWTNSLSLLPRACLVVGSCVPVTQAPVCSPADVSPLVSHRWYDRISAKDYWPTTFRPIATAATYRDGLGVFLRLLASPKTVLLMDEKQAQGLLHLVSTFTMHVYQQRVVAASNAEAATQALAARGKEPFPNFAFINVDTYVCTLVHGCRHSSPTHTAAGRCLAVRVSR